MRLQLLVHAANAFFGGSLAVLQQLYRLVTLEVKESSGDGARPTRRLVLALMRATTQQVLSVEHTIHCLTDLEVHEDRQASRQECGRVVQQFICLVDAYEVCVKLI